MRAHLRQHCICCLLVLFIGLLSAWLRSYSAFSFFVFDFFFNTCGIPGTEQGLGVIAVCVDEDEMVSKTPEMCDPHLKMHQRGWKKPH